MVRFFTEQPLIIQVQVIIIALLWLSFIVFSIIILTHRVKRNMRNYYHAHLEKDSEKWIYEWVLNDHFQHAIESSEGLFELKKHYHLHYTTALDNEVLTDLLVKLHKTLTGEVKEHISLFFYALALDVFTLSMLKRSDWGDKAKAMRIISEMKIEKAGNALAHYIDHRHTILRQEARLAYVLINPVNLTRVLENATRPFSDWEIMSLIDIINKDKTQYFQHFTPVFKERNDTIILLSLQIINIFKLSKYKHELLKLLDSTDNYVVSQTISAIENFAFSEALPLLIIKYKAYEDTLKAKVLTIIGKMGSHQHRDFLIQQTAGTETVSVRLQGIGALLAIGIPASEIPGLLAGSMDETQLQQMLAHNLDIRIPC